MNSSTQATDSAWAMVFAAWVVATTSTLGAMFFSEALELPPGALSLVAVTPA